MADPVTRSAARWAAVVAVPVALVAGLVVYRLLSATDHPSAAGSPPVTSPSVHSTAPVDMAAPPLSAHDTDACALLVSHLPETVRDRARRPVTSGSEQNAAYGDPAITLACGTGAVASVVPTATVYNLSGVCWYPVSGSAATTWHTVDRNVPVTVVVPNTYDAQPQWVVAFSPAVATALPAATSGVPTGCHG